MAAHGVALGPCLDQLRAVLPCRYAQWLVEDPATWDYRVVALHAPPGEAGYEVAHRTGVIGQVFRTGRAILVADAPRHPLYDPYDPAVEWELAVPAWDGDRLAAVLNFEGSGVLALDADLWRSVGEVVRTATRWRLPDTPPRGDVTRLVTTTRLTVRSFRGEDARPDVVAAARGLTLGGNTVLLVGEFPELMRGPYPTVTEAEARRQVLAECVYGVGPRLDLLPTVPQDQALAAFRRLGGWSCLEGRYPFILHSLASAEEAPPCPSTH